MFHYKILYRHSYITFLKLESAVVFQLASYFIADFANMTPQK